MQHEHSIRNLPTFALNRASAFSIIVQEGDNGNTTCSHKDSVDVILRELKRVKNFDHGKNTRHSMKKFLWER